MGNFVNRKLKKFNMAEHGLRKIMKKIWQYRNETEFCPVCCGQDLEWYKDEDNVIQESASILYHCQNCMSTWNVIFNPEPRLVTNVMIGDCFSEISII